MMSTRRAIHPSMAVRHVVVGDEVSDLPLHAAQQGVTIRLGTLKVFPRRDAHFLSGLGDLIAPSSLAALILTLSP